MVMIQAGRAHSQGALWCVASTVCLVVHAQEKEAGGGHGRAGGGAIARRDHLVDPFHRPPPAPDLHKSTDNRADHVAEETVSGDLVGDQLATTTSLVLRVPCGGEFPHSRREDCPLRRLDVAALRLERREV